MSRRTRIGGTLVLTAVALTYLVWKVDLGQTVDVLLDSEPAWVVPSKSGSAAPYPGCRRCFSPSPTPFCRPAKRSTP
jgi:hypothetical protein